METILDFITLILIITWLISQIVLFIQLNKRIKRVEERINMAGLALQVQKDINDLSERQFKEIAKEISNIKSTKKGKK